MRYLNAIGIIALISACWLWIASRDGVSDADVWNALAFGAVIYFGMRSR